MKNTLKNRYDVIALVNATMCNPNGDPDMNNLPRTDYSTGRGILTDVAVKSRIRGYVLSACGDDTENNNILIKANASVNKAIAEAAIAVNPGEKLGKTNKNSKTEDSQKFMCEKYWDVRTFGGVLSTGLNAGQVTGAVQVGMSLSVDPIEPSMMTISRKCYTDNAQDFGTLEEYDKADAKMSEDQKRTLGKKAFIPYGLYPIHSVVNANLAEKVGFTEEDFDIFLEALSQMYDYEPTSSKAGMSVLAPIIVFKHVGHESDPEAQRARECKLGCASMQKLHSLLSIVKKDGVDVPRNINDYDITLKLSQLPDGIACGIKNSAFDKIEWLTGKEDIKLFNF